MISLKSKYKGILFLLGLITLFLTFRLTVLFSYLDKIYEQEELYKGTIAREVIRGPLISLWEYLDYKVEYFSGGVLTVGIMAVPFFLLFGQTYISLKLVGLTFALATFILWYLFLGKFFSRGAAVICAFLFIFSMPLYTKTSLVCWGQHPENSFFTIISIYIFYLIFFRRKDKKGYDVSEFYNKGKGYFFLLGLTAGLGMWFVTTFLITITFIFLFWFIFDKRFFLRKIVYIYGLGFLMGFSPAIYYDLIYKGDIFSISGTNLFREIISCNLNGMLPKLYALLLRDLPRSFIFDRFFNISGIILSYIYYAVFIAAFVYLLWVNRKCLVILFRNIIYPITLKEIKVAPYDIPKELLLLTYPLLFFLAYSTSNYYVSPQPWEDPNLWPDYLGYRYMIPVMPFILAILAIFLDKIKNRRVLFSPCLSLILGLGLIGNINLISLKNFGKFNEDKGYSYNIIGDKIGLRITKNLAQYIAPFEKLEENLRFQFYEGLGGSIYWRLRREDISQPIKIIETEIKPQYRPYCYRGWGALFSLELPEEFDKALSIANNIPLKYRPFFYEGLGRIKDMAFFGDMKRTLSLINKIEKIYQPYCYIGVGYSIGFEFKNDKANQLQLVSVIDKEYREYVSRGIFLGMKER